MIVQGRYDMICPPAHRLGPARRLARARACEMVANAGHALSEPGITAALVRAMDRAWPRPAAPRSRQAVP